LQGNMSQPQRDRAMGGFRAGHFDILVATDIAARGIDVANVSHVINFDVPNTPDAYTHRIGRTGRAERSGKACTLVCDADRAAVHDIERRLGAPITRRTVPGFETLRSPAGTERPAGAQPVRTSMAATFGNREHANLGLHHRGAGGASRHRVRRGRAARAFVR
jgi:ATP-dependent RNA helicase RhlE